MAPSLPADFRRVIFLPSAAFLASAAFFPWAFFFLSPMLLLAILLRAIDRDSL
jgi:hypothetical protein